MLLLALISWILTGLSWTREGSVVKGGWWSRQPSKLSATSITTNKQQPVVRVPRISFYLLNIFQATLHRNLGRCVLNGCTSSLLVPSKRLTTFCWKWFHKTDTDSPSTNLSVLRLVMEVESELVCFLTNEAISLC